MVVRYIGGVGSNCESCSGHTGKHPYEWELIFKSLYPKDSKTTLIVCEKCARREAGTKNWLSVRRGG